MKHTKWLLLWLISIALIGIAVRSFRITAPIADWHSWRQADTAAVARNFLKFGFDPLRPRYDDLSNIQSGRDNPNGWRMVEFPVYQLVAAGIARVFSQVPIEVWLRVVSIICSVGTAVILGWFVTRTSDMFTGVVTGFLLAILPYNVYYGRTVLPEVPLVFLTTCSVIASYLFYNQRKPVWIILSAVTGSLALLVKPTGIFLLLPAMYLFLRVFFSNKKTAFGILVWGVVVVLPVLLWRQWISQFPEGIPAYGWLLNSGNIRFKGAWFQWLFAKRLGELLLGYWGLVPFVLGLALKVSKKEFWIFHIWLFGVLLYWVVFAWGNVQHDYYQIVAVVPVVVFVAKGFVHLIRDSSSLHPLLAKSMALAAFLFMMAFSWYTIRTYYWINRPEIVEAGRTADALIPKNAKVIASYNGDTTFLYQINRQGWPLGFEIDKKIAQGATHYVTVSPGKSDGETEDLASRYHVIVRNDKFAIIDLTKPVQSVK